jgi:hypothetical protein
MFFESMLESPFAIVFSPFDIAPGFMLELLEADVPIFALTKRVIGEMNNFREGVSGEIVDIGCVVRYPTFKGCFVPQTPNTATAVPAVDSLSTVLAKLDTFLQQLHSYKPLLDLGEFGYMPYMSTYILRHTIPSTLRLSV